MNKPFPKQDNHLNINYLIRVEFPLPFVHGKAFFIAEL